MEILICPSCDYRRHLTEAQASVSGALVVACLKCGSAMRCDVKTHFRSSHEKPTFLESLTPDPESEWVVP
jgi:hypothetical protein